MTRGQDILEELQGISPELARIGLAAPYQEVPAGYFDKLAGEIMSRIKNEESASAGEEMAILSPLLSRLDRKTPFSVPKGYFEQLSPNISETRKEIKGAKVISMPAKRIFRYAVAAVAVGLITTFAWFFISGPRTKNDRYALKQDSAAEKLAIENISQISDNEIEYFIEGTSIISGFDQSLADLKITDEDMRLILTEISDQELETYLEQHIPSKEKFN